MDVKFRIGQEVRDRRGLPDRRWLTALRSGIPGSILGRARLASNHLEWMMRCDHCGAEVSEQEQTCPGCGSSLLQDIRAQARYVLGKHAGPVLALTYHPQGSSVVSVGEDGSVYLWSFSTRREPLFEDQAGRVGPVAFSPDGRYLAAAIDGADGSTVSLLDVERGEPRIELSAPETWISALAYSPDGTRVAAGCKDGTVKVWSVERILRHQPEFATIDATPPSFRCGDDILTSVAFNPTSDNLVVGSLDQLVRVWNVGGMRFVDVAQPEQIESVRAVAYDPFGRLMACACDGGSLGQTVYALTFSRDGHRLLAGGADDAIQVWDASTGENLGPLAPDSGQVRALALSPDGSNLVSGHFDGTVHFWELAPATTRGQEGDEQP
jgi:WD40 repeat protein